MPQGRCRVLFILAVLAAARLSAAQDWPQWRGPNRDARASGFEAPREWPAELTKTWSVTVGDGVATPSLVGDRLYVYAREGGNEVLRCLSAETGEEVWKDSHPADQIQGAAGGFPGPRCSPAVAEGKVVTLGAQGVLTCLDAASGKVVWRKSGYEGDVPRFNPSSSPLIVGGKCVVQLGSEGDGVIVAYDLTNGEVRWKWSEDGPAYGSPVLTTIDGTEAVIAPTDRNLVALDAADGTELWKISYTQGRYNAATPIIDGAELIYAGPTRGITAVALKKDGAKLSAEKSWSNGDNSVIYNTPVKRDGLLFGITNLNSLFCLDAKTGETKWNAPLSGGSPGAGPGNAQPGNRPPGQRPGGGRRGGGGGGGYGSVVDAGEALFALTPEGRLVAFAPSAEEFKQLGSYKVADGGTYAYPVIAGKRIYIKDRDAVTLWTIE